ncbi:TniQ family protein [Caulobacter sp. Root1455]|uniref:TniQ family protein n=1 Tax=Caulobacter sp. Root1455 TaxID=1736465 RepID=UPI001F1753CE|nr:TniQ family protein [Caulobacter sp. Root1455]
MPFAPRPMAGEGLSSWVARLAAHNFVTAADFWSGLGCDDPQDLAPPDGLFDQLSESTRLNANELRRFFAPDPATIAAPLALSRPAFIRGAACPACCRDAADRVGDHFVSASSASSWRFSCPKHRVRLAGLDGYGLVLQDGAARFVHEGSRTSIGATHFAGRPAEFTLAFEDALMRALSGQPPGPQWLPRTPATFLVSATALIEVVLWRPGSTTTFAHQFDEIRNGSATFSIGASDRRHGTALLADQGPRDRMNVYAAVATLLAWPQARSHPFSTVMRWNDPHSPGPFVYAFDELDDRLRAILTDRLQAWPGCIATPARRALQRPR